MDENSSQIRDAAEAVKGVLEAVPIYDDAIQPAAKKFGKDVKPAATEAAKAIVTIAKAGNVVLAPLRLLVWGYEQIEGYLIPKLAEKFKGKEERIVAPKFMVAGPVVEALKFAGSEPELREMYLNLLASSMDSRTVKKAHPAFVDIIRQMVPDEIRILRHLFQKKIIRARYKDPRVRANLVIEHVGRPAECEHLDLVESCIDNLNRLGIAKHLDTNIPAFDEAYIVDFSLEITALGENFYEACVEGPP